MGSRSHGRTYVIVTVSDPRVIVAAKRDRQALTPEQVEAFVAGYSRGSVSDALAASFLMAALLNGMDDVETTALTRALIASGETIAIGSVARPSVDKHSTGGVADGVTLVFVPLVAALGLSVAKLSGRGLGHTGGTLDKLESIPGLRTTLSTAEIERQVQEVGCAVAAQSPRLVPADGALYALRDATATVPSVPLIAASVMSKKLAVETDLVILDVKVGTGAFMKTLDDATSLAGTCLRLAQAWGRACRVAVTDMSQPLGDAIGNAVEVLEAVTILRGGSEGRLTDLAVWFAGRALESLEGVPFETARDLARRALGDGSALERFRSMVRAQGGDPAVVDDPGRILPRAPVVVPILSDRGGWLASTRAEAIGMASGALGAGRVRRGDRVDPSVGIVLRPKIGDRIEEDEPIGEVHARDRAQADHAVTQVLSALEVADVPHEAPQLVVDWME